MSDATDTAPKFAIDKFVAIPKSARPTLNGRAAIYPWAHMEPGDSFFVPGGKAGTKDKRPGVIMRINPHGARVKYPGTTWVTRAVTENGVNGIRVWRTK